MTPEEAADLAARILAALDREAAGYERIDPGSYRSVRFAADRERVASDLAGLRHHTDHCLNAVGRSGPWPCDDARRYADGLRRTAAIYGVT